MKRLLLFIVFDWVCSTAYCQIPNADMELWDSQPILLNWETNSRPMTLPPWDPYIVKQDTERYSGNYAANLFANGIFKAYATTTFAVANHPSHLSLYYKAVFAPCVNDPGFRDQDTVSVLVELLNNSAVVDQGYWEGLTTTSVFTQLSVPLSQNAWQFDSCRITLHGGKVIGGCGIIAASTQFKVDHLELKYSAQSGCIDSSLICDTCACIALYDPVCGCDGQTYSNSCEALIHGVTSWGQGACLPLSGCIDSSQMCPVCPCPMVYNPVCGCDGVTYDNPCFATNAGVTSWTQGRCGSGACKADFIYAGNTVAPATVQFLDMSTGNITAWNWTFPDGTVATVSSPSFTFNQSGNYVVCLRITSADTSGILCSDSICQNIFIDDSSNACINPSLICDTCPCPAVYDPVCGCDGITYDNDCMAQNAGVVRYTPGACSIVSPCEAYFYYWSDTNGYEVHFEYASGWIPTQQDSGVILLWNFGDGSTSTDSHPVHTYTDTSIHAYLVCLTVSDTAQNCTNNYCDSVYVGTIVRGCYAGFGYVIDSTGVVVVYPDSSSATPSGGGIWVWGTDSTSTNPNPSFQLDSNSNYNICYIVMNDSMQCTDTVCIPAAQLYAEFRAMGIPSTSADIRQVYLYPNPTLHSAELRFSTSRSSFIEVAVKNLLGETVYQIPGAHLAAGTYAYTLKADQWSKGIYLVELRTNGLIGAVRKLSKE